MKKFSKKFTNRKGEEEVLEYEYDDNTLTKNQQMSKDIKKTRAEFEEEALETITKQFKEDVPIGAYVRYIVKDKKGKMMARNGGVVMKKEDKYLMLKNTRNNVAWSVQYENIVGVYVIHKMKTAEEKEKEEQEKQAKIEAEKKKKEEMRELKKKEKKDTKKADREKAKEDKKVENEKIMFDLYYEQNMMFGRDKFYKTIQEKGHKIPRKQVEEWLRQQALYQLTKPVEKEKNYQAITAKAPWNIMNMDLVIIKDVPVLNVVDKFSRHSYSRVIPNKTQMAVINGLKDIFKDRHPKAMVMDNGPEFKGKDTKKYLTDLGIKSIYTTPHNPQANGLVERNNGTIKRIFEKMELKNPDIKFNQSTLDKMTKAYNTSYHEVIDMSPLEAMKPENAETVLARNKKHESFQVMNLDNLKVGDKVRSVVKHEDKDAKKYRPNWTEEIFTVKSITRPKQVLNRPIQYKIMDSDGETERGLFTRKQLQKVDGTPKNEKLVEMKYIVEKFMGEDGGKLLVKWKGFRSTPKNNTYQLKSVLKSDLGAETYTEMYDDFKRREKEARERKKKDKNADAEKDKEEEEEPPKRRRSKRLNK